MAAAELHLINWLLRETLKMINTAEDHIMQVQETVDEVKGLHLYLSMPHAPQLDARSVLVDTLALVDRAASLTLNEFVSLRTLSYYLNEQMPPSTDTGAVCSCTSTASSTTIQD